MGTGEGGTVEGGSREWALGREALWREAPGVRLERDADVCRCACIATGGGIWCILYMRQAG